MTAAAQVLRPVTSELAAVAWLRALPGLDHDMVDVQLPRDQDAWAQRGFVVVAADVGGPPGAYVPWAESVVQLECYGVNPRTLLPDWATAGTLAQLVINAAVTNEALGTALPTREGWHPVRITSAYPTSGPRRATTDPSSYALYRLDLALTWVQADPQQGDTPS